MPRDVRAPLLGSALCALLIPPVALLAYKFGPAVHLDTAIVRHLAAPVGGSDYQLAENVSGLVNPLPFLVLATSVVALGLAARRYRETVAAVAILVGADISTQVLKHLLDFPRFQPVLGYSQPWADSFPSGHTTAAASLAAALVLVVPSRLRPLAAAAGTAFVLAVGIGLVVIKAHYPSDVLGALLVVGSWALAAVAALRLIRPRRPERRGKSESASGGFAISLQ